MIRCARIRRTLGITLLAGALTPPALLASQAGAHTAFASINVVPPPVPADGTWTALAGPISPVVVTRQQTPRGGKLLTRFVVRAVSRTNQAGSGATPWRLLGRYDLGTVSVTVTWPCPGRAAISTSAAPPVCPNLRTDLTLTTTRNAPAFITVTDPNTKFATLSVLDHTLAGDVGWTELLSQP